MKKILTAIIVLMFAVSTCHAKTPVNLCDAGQKDFYEAYNVLREVTELPGRIAIDESQITSAPANGGTRYLLPLKNYSKTGMSIALLVNSSNMISQIELMSNDRSHDDDFGMAFGLVLMMVGFTPDEIDDVAKKTDNLPNNTYTRYLETTHRYVNIHYILVDQNNSIYKIVMDAYTE